MARIPFVRESAGSDASAESLESLINLYAEKAPDGARSPWLLRSTPGLIAAYGMGSGPIRAMNADMPGIVYVVSGTTLYQLSINGLLPFGTVGAFGDDVTGRFVTLAVGPTLGMVCVPPNVYYFNVPATSVTQVSASGGQFSGAGSVAYLNGRFVFTDFNASAGFFCSNLFDPTTSDPLSFAFADNLTDVIRRVVVFQGELWLFGLAGIQIWNDAGLPNFPFASRGIVIPHGCSAARSVATGGGSIFWLGPNRVVYRNDAYSAVRISTHAIEGLIRKHTPVSNYLEQMVTSAFVHEFDGHTFYVLNFIDLTICYDLTTGLWHQRSTSTNSAGGYCASHAVLTEQWLFSDASNGNTYFMDSTVASEAGVVVQRTAILPPLWADTKRAFMSRVELEMQQGQSSLRLTWSDDDGATYKGDRTLSNAGSRAFTTRLGSFRKRTLALTGTGVMNLLAMDADMTQGEW